MVDRGVVTGYAHIHKWKLDGKLDKKLNTFQDFIECSQGLMDSGMSDNKNLVTSGASAGGLLIGAVMNMKADWTKIHSTFDQGKRDC